MVVFSKTYGFFRKHKVIYGQVFFALFLTASGYSWDESEAGKPLDHYFALDQVTLSGLQSANGSVFVGGDNVYMYNGVSWKKIHIPGVYEIGSMVEDEEGRIWLAAIGGMGYLERNKRGYYQYVSLTSFLPEGEETIGKLSKVFLSPYGVVFIGEAKVYRWREGRFEIFKLQDKWSLYASEINGKIYLHSVEVGIYLLRENGPELLIPDSELNGAAILTMIDFAEMGILMVSNYGMMWLRDGVVSIQESEVDAFLRKSLVIKAIRLDEKIVAISTYRGGIVLVDLQGTILRVIDQTNELINREVRELWLDREGGFWITQPQGVFRIETSSAVTLFDQDNGFEEMILGEIVVLNGEKIILAKDGLYKFRRRKSVVDRAELDLKSEINQTLYCTVDVDGAVLLGGYWRILEWDGKVSSEIFWRPFRILSLFQSNIYSERVYFGGEFEVDWLERNEAGEWTDAKKHIQLPNSAHSLFEDNRGDLWVGTKAKGVHRIENSLLNDKNNNKEKNYIAKIHHYNTGDLLPEGHGAVIIAGLGDKILGLSEGGLISYHENQNRFKVVAGLPENHRALAISKDGGSGSAWLGIEIQLNSDSRSLLLGKIILSEDGEFEWIPYAVPGLNRIGTITNLFLENVESDPILWVSGSSGILRVKVNEIRERSVPIAPMIVSAESSDAGIVLNPFSSLKPEISYQGNHLSFSWAAPIFRETGPVLYQTRMLGFEGVWSEPAETTFREYTNLGEGTYAFEVRVMDIDGTVGPAVKYAFSILPPWYRTNWAYAVFALCFLSSLYGFYQLRVAQIKKRTIELEGLVEKRTHELARANSAKTDFIASMSHEIRNPMNGVIGLTNMLQEANLPSNLAGVATSLRKCAEYLSSIVEDVLDFSKIESGKITLDEEVFDLRAMVADITEIFSWQSKEKRMPIEQIIWENLPTRLLGDEGKIKQILINYVANAFKFAGKGKLILSVEGETHYNEVSLTIKVTDEGPGIPEEEQAGLFEKFNRGKMARQENIGGTGLGLAACKAFAEKMGGSVGLESELGKGSTFLLNLRLVVVPEEKTSESKEVAAGVNGSTRALIVEDQEYNVLVIEAILHKLGYQTDVAVEGFSALEMLKAQHYDIVFMDWDLPGMNGVEVTRLYREWEPADRHALIVATTAYSTQEKKIECMHAGMDGFATKPLSPSKIRQTIQNLSGAMKGASSIHVESDQLEEEEADLDMSIITMMADGDPIRERELISKYIITLETDVEGMVAAMEAKDSEETRRHAHRILSQTALVAATKIAASAKEIQEAARAGDTEFPQKISRRFQREVDHLKKRLWTLNGRT